MRVQILSEDPRQTPASIDVFARLIGQAGGPVTSDERRSRRLPCRGWETPLLYLLECIDMGELNILTFQWSISTKSNRCSGLASEIEDSNWTDEENSAPTNPSCRGAAACRFS